MVADVRSVAHDTVGRLPITPRPATPATPLLSRPALDMIIAGEVGSPRLYQKKFQRPVWPGGASGATIGIGYDLGMGATTVIASDWQVHPQMSQLLIAAGKSGTRGRVVTQQMQDVVTPYPLAETVFQNTSVVRYYRMTRRAFGSGFAELPPNAQGALVSLVFNRGSNMLGDRRAEMRVIRDVCIPQRDLQCIATQLRIMERLWQGTPIERGMHLRRGLEIRLVFTPETV